MIDKLTAFEIKAEVFRMMTGIMAPGKDSPSIANDDVSFDEKAHAWREWHDDYGFCFDMTLKVAANMLGLEDDAT